MLLTQPLTDRDSAINAWLGENPLVLGAVFGLLGLGLVYFGAVGLRSGTTKDKYGNELTGGRAKLSSVVRIVAGIAAVGFAIYVSIFGAP